MMPILSQLSSQVGDRTEYANRKVVVQCLDDPSLLDQIAEGLRSPTPALAGDCAEVMTHVAEYHPDWIEPYVTDLSPLLRHPTARARWEAVHALALVSKTTPRVIDPLLPLLEEIIRSDTSVIARDYAVDAVGNYVMLSRAASEKVYIILREALTLWDGKQAGRALKGLANVAVQDPSLREELAGFGGKYARHPRGVVRKAAKDLLKVLQAGPPTSQEEG